MRRRAKTQVTQGYFLSPQVAFVAHPVLAGVWMLTHGSVLIAPCDYCKALVGELCVNDRKKPISGTHHVRRTAAKPVSKRVVQIPHVVVTRRNPFYEEPK